MRNVVAISTIYYDDDHDDDVDDDVRVDFDWSHVVCVVHADYDGEGQEYCYY